MNARRAAITLAIILTAMLPPASSQIVRGSSLCAVYVGPAFIIPNEYTQTIAVHAGSFPGVSLLSLTTGHMKTNIPVSRPILAGIMSHDSATLLLALSDAAGLRISSFDVATQRLTSTRVFRGIDARLAVFAPNARLMLGVTPTGTIFKIELQRGEIEEATGTRASATSLAVSPSSTRLYVAGDGLSVIDIDHMKLSSEVTQEKNLLEVAASPDDHLIVVRNLHDVEVFDTTRAHSPGPVISAVVNPILNGASISSTARLAFSADGSKLFYITASDVDPELMLLSMNNLHVEKRISVGPYPNAIAVAPDQLRVFVTSGFLQNQHLDAIYMSPPRTVFRVALRGGSSASSETSASCANVSRSDAESRAPCFPGDGRMKSRFAYLGTTCSATT